MNKCIASKDGVCQNIYAFGLKCGGYSTECKLKKQYDKIANIGRVIRKHYGLVSDQKGGVTDET